MELTNVLSPEQIKQYLYGELSGEETQAIEEQLFVDSNLFYEITSFENELIDKYVQGKLEGEDLNRFEQSLTRSGERREQVKNARALQRHISEQQKSSAPVAVIEASRQSIRSRLSSLFSFPSNVMQYAMAVLIAFLGIGGAWLLYDGYRMRQELAQARNEQAQLERDLQKNIEDAKRQMESSEQKTNEQNGTNAKLNEELNEREAKLQQLEKDLESLRRQKGSQNDTPGIYVATIIPIGSRGSAKEITQTIKRGFKVVTFKLPLETETDYDDYEVKGVKAMGQSVISENGEKFLLLTLPAQSVKFSVTGKNSETGVRETINEYQLEIRRH